jgi:hypothetical protein
MSAGRISADRMSADRKKSALTFDRHKKILKNFQN